MKVFLDSNVPMYAIGKEHPLREPSLEALKAVVAGTLDAVTDVEVLQEILYRYHAIKQLEKGLALSVHFRELMGNSILPVTAEDLDQTRLFMTKYVGLPPRDCVHLAVMKKAGVETILTADRHFDQVAGIRVLNLAEWRPGNG